MVNLTINTYRWLFIRSLLVFLLIGNPLWAQESEDFTELDKIEAEIDSQRSKPRYDSNSRDDNDPSDNGRDLGSRKNDDLDQAKKPIKVTDINQLEAFSNLAIIHPRFLPKSGRFQVSVGGNAILNDPWFNQFGLSLRASYHISEFFGLELAANTYSGSSSTHAKDLAAELNVQTSSLIQPKSYYGLHAYFIPFYGKMSLFNQRIVPFDVFMTLGAGQTQVEGARETGVSTIHLGAGQLFALSRQTALRWDIGVNMFTAQSRSQASATATQNVAMSFAYSYFFPEVKR